MSAARFAFSIPTGSDAEQHRLFTGFTPVGFDGLQLKGGQYTRYVGQPERFLEEWGSAGGASAGLICGGDLNEDGIAALHRLFDFAAAIGTELIIFCHGRSRATVTADDIRHFAAQLSELGEAAAGQGLKLSLHNHFDNPVMHRADFETFFSEIRPGIVGLTLDTAHLVKSGVHDIAGVIRDYGAFIDNVHLKDFESGQFKTLGRGEIDFRAVFEALREIDYQGWLCADEESETGVEEALRASYDFIERGWNSVAKEQA